MTSFVSSERATYVSPLYFGKELLVYDSTRRAKRTKHQQLVFDLDETALALIGTFGRKDDRRDPVSNYFSGHWIYCIGGGMLSLGLMKSYFIDPRKPALSSQFGFHIANVTIQPKLPVPADLEAFLDGYGYERVDNGINAQDLMRRVMAKPGDEHVRALLEKPALE